jgi:hypothetical protein
MAYKKIIINGTEYTNFRDFKLKKTLNQVHNCEFRLFSLANTDYSTNIIFDSLVVIFEVTDTNEIEIFRGYIRNINKISNRNCCVFCYNAAIKFFDRTWDERKEYTNTATNTILSEVASGIMDIGTNAITETISTRFELDNKLRSVAQLANIHAGEWWIDTNATVEDRINIDYARYSVSSVYTVNIGLKFLMSEDNTYYDKVYNCITILGRGDGINQVKSQSYGFCFYTPYITATISDIATSLTVSDATGFAASDGIIYINNEKIYYTTLTGTTLSGLTRGYDSTTAAYHSENMRVWYAGTTANEYTKTNPAPDSSVDVYGIKEYTYPDKTIIANVSGDKNESAGKVAYLLFQKFYSPVRVITIRKRNISLNFSDTEVFEVGKTITITDSRTDLDGNFKIFDININEKTREMLIQANNLPYDFSTQLDEIEKNMDTSSTYGQGATNIYSVNLAENCDATHPLNMRFYIPEEAVAINRIKLNFKIKNYRAYTTANANESAHRHDIDPLTITSHTHGVPELTVKATATQSNTSIGSTPTAVAWETTFTTNSYDRTGTIKSAIVYARAPSTIDGLINLMVANYDAYCSNFTGSFQSCKLEFVDFDGSANTSSTTSVPNGGYMHYNFFKSHSIPKSDRYLIVTELNNVATTWWGQVNFMVNHNHGSHNHSIPQLTVTGSTTVAKSSIGYSGNLNTNPATSSTGSEHTHGITWGIYENSISSPSINITAGLEGSESAVGTYTSDQDNIDITDIIEAIGADNWINIKFTPNQNMRIDACAYIQIYIESN